jgi:hypothetical protein
LNLPYPDDHPGNHPLREKPVDGELYYIVRYPELCRYSGGFEVLPVIYHCAAPSIPPFMSALQPILLTKSFLRPDSCHYSFPGAELQSTLFWTHALSTFDKDEVTISFYTNELLGNFTCSLQGICTEGVISQTFCFPVR